VQVELQDTISTSIYPSVLANNHEHEQPKHSVSKNNNLLCTQGTSASLDANKC